MFDRAGVSKGNFGAKIVCFPLCYFVRVLTDGFSSDITIDISNDDFSWTFSLVEKKRYVTWTGIDISNDDFNWNFSFSEKKRDVSWTGFLLMRISCVEIVGWRQLRYHYWHIEILASLKRRETLLGLVLLMKIPRVEAVGWQVNHSSSVFPNSTA